MHFFLPVETDISSTFLLNCHLQVDALALILYLAVGDTGGINRFQNLEITQHWIVNVIQGQISESKIT